MGEQGGESFSAPDALATNQAGRLTAEQSRHWDGIARARRRGIRRAAWVPAAIGILLLFANGSASSAAQRKALGSIFLAIAAVMLAAPGWDSLTADVREGRVEAVEGAIRKHRLQGQGANATRFYLDIAGLRLRTGGDTYRAAPEAGIVRAYYFPRSRRVVNLKHLPDRPLPAGPDSAQQVLANAVNALRSLDPVAIAEARASAAALVHAVQGPTTDAGQSGAGRTRPHRDDLCGSWANPLITVTFAEDGTATVTMLGGVQRVGHWSIDASGRLLTDATGIMEPVDAWLDGERLTIRLEGQSVALTRTGRS